MNEPSIRLLTELVKRPSVTPEDAGCQSLIASRLEAVGFRCESMVFGEVTNLWARFGNTEPVLCFAGHTDVVPPGAPDQWESPPFEPSIRGDFLFGRGAADMKGGLAAMVTAAEQFVVANPVFDGSLAFLITSDEEGIARDGTRRVVETLVARDERIEWCVVGEPSSAVTLGDVVRVGRRGSLNGKVVIRGVQGHVAYPELADNPIRRFAPVLSELHETVWDYGNEYFPPTSFQVVDIESGVGAINVTPSHLKARFNFRYSTEWHYIGLQQRFALILDGHGIDYELEWQLSGEPFLTSPGELTQAAIQAIREETGCEPEMSTGGGTSDGRFISPAGADVIELGPVNSSIHKVNEHVRVQDILRLTSIYRRIMELLLRQ
jgi:succinyl-diaminopimelate desuccinylase